VLIRLTEAQSAKRINDCICRERARTLACRFCGDRVRFGGRAPGAARVSRSRPR
jgi:hypothetical protein